MYNNQEPYVEHDQASWFYTELRGSVSKVYQPFQVLYLDKADQTTRARLPSLYSDFSLQRDTNPDGYAANVIAWETALTEAAQRGLITADPDGPDFLSLRTGEELLQSLETKEWGRPLALETVIVGNYGLGIPDNISDLWRCSCKNEAVSQQHLIPASEFLDLPSSIYRRSWFPRRWLWAFRPFERASASKCLHNERYVIIKNVEVY